MDGYPLFCCLVVAHSAPLAGYNGFSWTQGHEDYDSVVGRQLEMKQGRTHGESLVTRQLFMDTSSAKGPDGHAEPALRTVVPKNKQSDHGEPRSLARTGRWADYARRGTAKAEKDEHGGSRTDGHEIAAVRFRRLR
ncbi:hypothetical protein F5144DRAFT_620075 [Chaetomium tenue]|uniref:Uncharacterized protein n=1 Tax=Chaetomium tenue TaxID=1854479 RepID=A0ACB7PCM4_9PEZI|nr:hypothetical protein F5144DRAFT_620075 [Chaetomium globosum]